MVKKVKKTLCCVCYTNLRRLRVKQYAVEYLGGKCNECGWIGDISGFDFHHKEPKEKEFNPNALNLANKSLNVVKERLIFKISKAICRINNGPVFAIFSFNTRISS